VNIDKVTSSIAVILNGTQPYPYGQNVGLNNNSNGDLIINNSATGSTNYAGVTINGLPVYKYKSSSDTDLTYRKKSSGQYEGYTKGKLLFDELNNNHLFISFGEFIINNIVPSSMIAGDLLNNPPDSLTLGSLLYNNLWGSMTTSLQNLLTSNPLTPTLDNQLIRPSILNYGEEINLLTPVHSQNQSFIKNSSSFNVNKTSLNKGLYYSH